MGGRESSLDLNLSATNAVRGVHVQHFAALACLSGPNTGLLDLTWVGIHLQRVPGASSLRSLPPSSRSSSLTIGKTLEEDATRGWEQSAPSGPSSLQMRSCSLVRFVLRLLCLHIFA